MTDALASTLAAGEVHVWWVREDEVAAPLLRAYEALLSAEERARHARFLVEPPRREYLVARALARTCLSRYAPASPRDWCFELGRWGRPEIASPAVGPPLRFNLTHTRGLVACAVALDRDVGIDVEDLTRARGTVAVANRFFAPAEVAALHRLPEDQQPARFFDYWTLKESYIKARGMGLALPLGAFAFDLEAPSPTIRFDARIQDDPASWQFVQLRPTARHLVAVAVRRKEEPDLAVISRECVPLGAAGS